MPKMLISSLVLSLMFSSTLSFAAEPEWKHVTVEGDKGLRAELSFQVQRVNRSTIAPELWVKVSSPNLNSDSIIDVQLWVADVDSKKFKEYRKPLELLFNKRKEHFTWFEKNVVVSTEGTTGGDVSSRYAISILQKESGDRETALLGVTEIDLKNAR